MYYLQENWEMKHGLTRRNLLKLSLLLKLIYFCIRYGMIITASFWGIFLPYLVIKSHRLMLFILFPIVIYLGSSILFINCFTGIILGVILYYYKLTFDQLNDQFDSIEKRSLDSVSIIDQKRLIRLVKRHDEKSQQLNLINLMIRRTIGWLYIALGFVQMIPLNMYLDEEILYYKIAYLVYLVVFLTGFII